MGKQKRYCLFENHNEYFVEYICSYKQCQEPSRWHCRECFQNNVHQHQQETNQHLAQIQTLTFQLEQESKLLEEQMREQSDLKQKLTQRIGEIRKNLDSLLQLAQSWDLQIQSNQNIIELYTFINNLKDNQLEIDDEVLLRLSQFQTKEIDYSQQDTLLDNLLFTIKQQQIQIEKLSLGEVHQQHNIQYNSRFIEADGFLEYINTASISNDEKYIAYGGNGWKIFIYDIHQQKKIHELEMKGIVTACQFSQDSQKLMVGDADGKLYFFNNQFQQQYLVKIHQSSINQLYFKTQNQLLTCSYDQQIIETDIDSQKQLLRIQNAHKNSINTLAFDKINNMILSGSSDKCIKAFNQEGKQVICKQDAHYFQISQIQCIEQYQKLISLDIQGNLKVWLINYQNLTLWETNSFAEQEMIQNFISFKNDQFLFLICDNYIKIMDDQGNRKKIIKYDGDISNSIRNIQQLQSLNQIVILQQSIYVNSIILDGLLLLSMKE